MGVEHLLLHNGTTTTLNGALEIMIRQPGTAMPEYYVEL